MKTVQFLLAAALACGIVACGQQGTGTGMDSEEGDAAAEQAVPGDSMDNSFEVVPGLTARILKNGYGRAAEAGDLAAVHYTGWLYDESAPQNRGSKFDSSVDRGEQFQFPLGAGRVIQGWDQGVPGMLIGETRELTIAPGMAYGDRGAGNVIPPGATLVFEVELMGLTGPSDSP